MKRYIINKGFITQKIKDKVTIFSGEESVLFTLNGPAAIIFQGCKLQWDKQRIKKEIQKNYPVSDEVAEKDIEEFIHELSKKKILEEIAAS